MPAGTAVHAHARSAVENTPWGTVRRDFGGIGLHLVPRTGRSGHAVRHCRRRAATITSATPKPARIGPRTAQIDWSVIALPSM
jgi:hypothetical protein